MLEGGVACYWGPLGAAVEIPCLGSRCGCCRGWMGGFGRCLAGESVVFGGLAGLESVVRISGRFAGGRRCTAGDLFGNGLHDTTEMPEGGPLRLSLSCFRGFNSGQCYGPLSRNGRLPSESGRHKIPFSLRDDRSLYTPRGFANDLAAMPGPHVLLPALRQFNNGYICFALSGKFHNSTCRAGFGAPVDASEFCATGGVNVGRPIRGPRDLFGM